MTRLQNLILSPTAAAALLVGSVPIASAVDFAAQAPPMSWMSRHLPEDLPDLKYPAYFVELDKASELAFAGRYRAALLTSDALDATDPAVAELRGRSLAAIGEIDAALTTLGGDAPNVRLARAQVLLAEGRFGEALETTTTLVADAPGVLPARLMLGRIHEALGATPEAVAAYGWFVEPKHSYLQKWLDSPNAGFDSAEDVVAIGQAIDRWASLTGAYRDNPSLNQAIYGMFTRAYDEIDRTYWPAKLAAAKYLASHDNLVEARPLLAQALDANPNDRDAVQFLGRISVQTYNFDAADAAIDALRSVRSDDPAADLIEARSLLAQRRARDAEAPARRVLDRQPQNLEALGLLAASYSLRLMESQQNETLAAVAEIDPDNASAYFEVAEQLSAMRQYPRSAAMYQSAIDRAPNWIEPRNGLGLLYTQSGDEDAARVVLEAARALDPFNLRTTNYLRLLDEMDTYDRYESDHFTILYQKASDPVIAPLFAAYLESIHPKLAAEYAHEPSAKTVIEVFPTHDMFSVRTTGSPWIGTVGASTGRVIAMVSPRSGERTMGPYNWSDVLRHEYTHTVTLSATENRIPHWMTEGLAVVEERKPLRWEWVPMLYAAVQNQSLFTLEELTWGFVRPKKPSDRQMAYAQSYWVCSYIYERFGRDAILTMFDRFRAGGLQDEVIPAVTGIPLAEFESGFGEWARKQTEGWGYDDQTTAAVKSLATEAEGLVKQRQFEQAVEAWQKVLALRPMDALPHRRLAGLYLSKEVDRPADAMVHLQRLNDVELNDNRYARQIVRLATRLNDTETAIRYAWQAAYINPYDLEAQRALLALLQTQPDSPDRQRVAEAVAQLEAMAETPADSAP